MNFEGSYHILDFLHFYLSHSLSLCLHGIKFVCLCLCSLAVSLSVCLSSWNFVHLSISLSLSLTFTLKFICFCLSVCNPDVYLSVSLSWFKKKRTNTFQQALDSKFKYHEQLLSFCTQWNTSIFLTGMFSGWIKKEQ